MGSCRCNFAPGFLTWPVVAARAVRWLNQQQINHPKAENSIMESPWKEDKGMATSETQGRGKE